MVLEQSSAFNASSIRSFRRNDVLMSTIFLPMAYKSVTRKIVRRVLCKILEMGVSKSGAPRAKRAEKFFEHPFLRGSVVYKYD